MSRREYSMQESDWDLIVDCPFNNSLIDVSGYEHHCSLISGNPIYTTIDNEVWLDARNAIIRLQNPQQDDYVNSFKLEFDFYQIATRNYWMLIDGFDDGSKYKGIKVGSSWGTEIGFGLGYGSAKYNDCVRGLAINKSNIQYNRKYHCIIENYLHAIEVSVIDTSTSQAFSATDITPTLSASQLSRPYLQIGSDSAWSGRQFDGYIRNLQLYKHK